MDVTQVLDGEAATSGTLSLSLLVDSTHELYHGPTGLSMRLSSVSFRCCDGRINRVDVDWLNIRVQQYRASSRNQFAYIFPVKRFFIELASKSSRPIRFNCSRSLNFVLQFHGQFDIESRSRFVS